MTRVGVLLLLAVGCTKSNPDATCVSGVCSDVSHAFCDSDGIVSGEPGACVAVKCESGVFGMCDGDVALVCNAQGNSYDLVACSNGCDAQRGCLSFAPSNGLGPALLDSQHEPDIVIPAGARIDTDAGIIQDDNGTTLKVKTFLVVQAGGPVLRVFEGRSFTVSGVTVFGAIPLALVSVGSVSITGNIAMHAIGPMGAPGAQVMGACVGGASIQYVNGCDPPHGSLGTSGGGNFQSGGKGGGVDTLIGGASSAGYSPLVGGCAGGAQYDVTNSVVVDRGGGGGGALQVVSSTQITFTEHGFVDLGGGGGQPTAGGGSGGTLILEAPLVSFMGATTGVAANGGAGGGCGAAGSDAGRDTSPALAPTCAVYFGGNGGTGISPARDACSTPGPPCANGGCPTDFGGGGGSVGRVRIATTDGSYTALGNPVLSAHIDTALLAK